MIQKNYTQNNVQKLITNESQKSQARKKLRETRIYQKMSATQEGVHTEIQYANHSNNIIKKRDKGMVGQLWII